ncbi:ABC transporter permease [Lampropedia aestuarii]|uniref:ABC transporter permease n=1 Tax=Lampropedia aestuarii TaxID=2562762 RepID=A0A4S5BXG8_9BURK|nr:ABC transporter permease [Lampropedia aestuarii]MDH5857742.1 ABC transporter permease [Lampropedia aestuarii]THJ35981.1 ABC transporter permease [Lampropedia aestuarii]
MKHPESPTAYVDSPTHASAPSNSAWNHAQEWWWLWWNNAYLGCAALVLLFTPDRNWLSTARVVILHTYLRLRWALLVFVFIMAMTNTVITAIVSKTLAQFGMGTLASTLMIRVMLVEAIPIVAALTIAIKLSIPLGAELSDLRRSRHLNRLHDAGLDAYRMEFLPRLLMGIYGVVMFSVMGSAVVVLTLYQGLYGFTSAGYDSFTNIFSRVMTPYFTFIFAGKAIAFGYIVALIPLTSAFSRSRFGLRRDTELLTLARMLFLIMVVEVLSLVVNYY